jgi:hypothetical protein
MPFWVHGTDAATGRPRDSLFIETEDEGDARQQAVEAGMTVEEVEFVERVSDDSPREDPLSVVPVAPPPLPTGARVQRLRCARCNSDRVVPRATIWEWGRDAGGGPLQAYVNAKPHALLFRGAVYATLYARVCADCGHTELFAEGAEELYKAYQQSLTEGAQ